MLQTTLNSSLNQICVVWNALYNQGMSKNTRSISFNKNISKCCYGIFWMNIYFILFLYFNICLDHISKEKCLKCIIQWHTPNKVFLTHFILIFRFYVYMIKGHMNNMLSTHALRDIALHVYFDWNFWCFVSSWEINEYERDQKWGLLRNFLSRYILVRL